LAQAVAATSRARADGGYPIDLARHGIAVRPDGRWRSVYELLGHPEVAFEAVTSGFPWLRQVAPRALAQLRTEVRYDGYLSRQQADIRSFQRDEGIVLHGVAFATIGGLSAEITAKLSEVQPGSLGAASRIQGMTPAALAAIAAHVRKQGRGAVSRGT
jgi:tRNA uridine 5-carboxymethylaminomethyl modification enzyme